MGSSALHRRVLTKLSKYPGWKPWLEDMNGKTLPHPWNAEHLEKYYNSSFSSLHNEMTSLNSYVRQNLHVIMNRQKLMRLIMVANLCVIKVMSINNEILQFKFNYLTRSIDLALLNFVSNFIILYAMMSPILPHKQIKTNCCYCQYQDHLFDCY